MCFFFPYFKGSAQIIAVFLMASPLSFLLPGLISATDVKIEIFRKWGCRGDACSVSRFPVCESEKQVMYVEKTASRHDRPAAGKQRSISSAPSVFLWFTSACIGWPSSDGVQHQNKLCILLSRRKRGITCLTITKPDPLTPRWHRLLMRLVKLWFILIIAMCLDEDLLRDGWNLEISNNQLKLTTRPAAGLISSGQLTFIRTDTCVCEATPRSPGWSVIFTTTNWRALSKDASAHINVSITHILAMCPGPARRWFDWSYHSVCWRSLGLICLCPSVTWEENMKDR